MSFKNLLSSYAETHAKKRAKLDSSDDAIGSEAQATEASEYRQQLRI
jgi:hypothetical protein